MQGINGKHLVTGLRLGVKEKGNICKKDINNPSINQNNTWLYL